MNPKQNENIFYEISKGKETASYKQIVRWVIDNKILSENEIIEEFLSNFL